MLGRYVTSGDAGRPKKKQRNKAMQEPSADDLNIIKYLKGQTPLPVFSEYTPGRFVAPLTCFQSSPKVFIDKSLKPNDTIVWALQALMHLFQEFPLKVYHFPQLQTYGISWSTEVVIFSSIQPYFTTIGKGLSLESSMASGLGEMMERFQNGRFFSKNPYQACIAPIYAIDVSETIRDMNQGWFQALKQNCPSISDWQESDRYFRYHDLDNTNAEVWIDEGLNSQSTGEVAGNTYEEAFVQGFSEIAERYSAFHVLALRKPLPDIPVSHVSSKIRKMIDSLENKGIRLRIKDASLGLPLPTVALLSVYDHYDAGDLGMFTGCSVCFGSASSLDVAVERCITESYEGVYDIKIRFHVNRLHALLTKILYRQFPQLALIIPYTEFCAAYYPSENFYPIDQLNFLDNDGGEPSWQEYNHSDCLEEIGYIREFLHERDWHLYIKDANWLGFPAMKIFIPEMNCPTLSTYYNYRKPAIRQFCSKLLADPYHLNQQDLAMLDAPAFILFLVVQQNLAQVFHIETRPLEGMNVWKFFGLLAQAHDLEETARCYLRVYSFFSHGDGLELESYKQYPETILPALARILPNCQQGCEPCNYSDHCRYPVKKKLEEYIAGQYQDYFCR